MKARSLVRGTALPLLVGGLSLFASAHEDNQWNEDREPPYVGPGFTNGVGGLPAANFPKSGVTLLGWIPVRDFGSLLYAANDCWGYTSPSGREYAIIGLSAKTGFVEITDPDDPVIVATHPSPNSDWRDVKTYQEYAYAVSEAGQAIQVFDLSAIDSGTVTYLGNAGLGDGTNATHNVAINEDSGFLYRTGGGSISVEGLRIYDLSDPANPTFVADWNLAYVHDAQVVSYTSGPLAGKEIAFLFAEDTSAGGVARVIALDVTLKNVITVLSQLPYSNGQYCHQGWLSEDRQYLYVNDELDEVNLGTQTTTRVIDVSLLHLGVMTEAGTFSPGTAAIDHNLFTRGTTLFEANYRSGLRVFDTSLDPVNPTQVAFFDTYIQNDNASFNGLWSIYPYYDSGVVIGSDIERGLFVWWIGDPLVSISFPDGVPNIVDSTGDTFDVSLAELNPGDLQGGTEALHYDTGSGFVTVGLTPLGGDVYRAHLPPIQCKQEIRFYVTADSTNGVTWRSPENAPTTTHSATSAVSEVVAVEDDLEVASGWTSGAAGDTATEGLWTRVDPNGTAAQPEDDHTPSGVTCWVTGQGVAGGDIDAADVDGGTTTLLSPVLDASSLQDPHVSYWRWFSNDQGPSPLQETLTVDVSDDGGSTWVNVETVGPAGTEVGGGWFRHQFRVADFILPTNQVRLRFRAADLGTDSIVEAAIDDLRMVDPVCFKNVWKGRPTRRP